MYLRCASCRSSTWVPTQDSGKLVSTLQCKKCAREYDLAGVREEGEPAERHDRVLKFADDNGIDMASAFSVMLGFMSLDDAREARSTAAGRRPAPAQPEPETAATSDAPAAAEAADYDPAFAEAVSSGRLGAEQAVERGNREVWASRVATRHGIPLVLAYRVADNEITIQEAVRKVRLGREDSGAKSPHGARRKQAPARSGRRRAGASATETVAWTPSRKAALGAAIGVAVLFLAFYVRDLWIRTAHHAPAPPVAGNRAQPGGSAASGSEPGGAESAPQGVSGSEALEGAEVSRDADGRVLMVAASDPSSVLVAFCASGPEAGRFEPVELTPAVPPFPGTRLGIMRDPAERNTRYAINIRRDRRSRRWVAGNGQQPIAATVAPLLPPDTPRVPVVRR